MYFISNISQMIVELDCPHVAHELNVFFMFICGEIELGGGI